MIAPNKISVPTDGNELEYSSTIKTKTGLDYEYKYTKSITKLDTAIVFSEDVLLKYLKNKTFVPIIMD